MGKYMDENIRNKNAYFCVFSVVAAFIGHIYMPGLLLCGGCVGRVKRGRSWLVRVRVNIHQICEW